MFLKFENLEDLVCTFKDADAVDSIELMLFIYLFICLFIFTLQYVYMYITKNVQSVSTHN